MISCSYANPTPWNSPRELDEDDLYERIKRLADQVEAPERAIFNLHVPPYDSGLDTARKINPDLTVVFKSGAPHEIPVGSHAVRQIIEEYQPLLALHGHIHESQGRRADRPHARDQLRAPSTTAAASTGSPSSWAAIAWSHTSSSSVDGNSLAEASWQRLNPAVTVAARDGLVEPVRAQRDRPRPRRLPRSPRSSSTSSPAIRRRRWRRCSSSRSTLCPGGNVTSASCCPADDPRVLVRVRPADQHDPPLRR